MKPTIANIISTIHEDKTRLGITPYDKVKEDEIFLFEDAMGIRLPDDMRTFYMYCNGLESDEDMFRIIPLREIVENKLNYRNNYLSNSKDFHFAEYMLYCDMWTISIDETNNIYSIYNMTDSVVTLTNSFSDFMDKFLSGGVFDGLYKWRDMIELESR